MGWLLSRVGGIIRDITAVFTWISGLTIFAMMFLISLDVVARYVFKAPLKGIIDLSQMMLVLICFLGLTYTQSEKGHVRIELLVGRLSRSKQLFFDGLTCLFGAFIFGLIAVQMAAKGFHILASEEVGPKTNLLFIPHTPFIFIAAMGCLLFSLRLILDASNSFCRLTAIGGDATTIKEKE